MTPIPSTKGTTMASSPWPHPLSARLGLWGLPAAVVLIMATGLAACGGGGGSAGDPTGPGSGAAPPPPPVDPGASARATLVVKVVDAFGIPAAAADVQHYLASASVYGQTNSEGTVTLDVPAGAGRVVARSVLGERETVVDLARDAREELRIELVPYRIDAFAVLGADVVPGSVAADGRSVELRIRISGTSGLPPWAFKLQPCVAREGDHLAALGPACVDKGDGIDRGWQAAGEVEVGELTRGGGVPVGPVLLLLDRSQRAGEIDAPEEHLFAAKALVANLLDGRSVAVGAFAGDGGPSGTASLLPEKPVTFYPVENPGWITDRVVAFEALESVRGRMGGSSALAAAIETGVDFLLARTTASDRPAMVVFTAGGSEGCSIDQSPGPNATSQCTAIRAAVERASQVGVSLWLVGPGDSWWPSSAAYASPGLISVARESHVWWAAAVFEGCVFGASEIVREALSGAPAFREVRFRISTEEAGSIAPGSEIRGDIQIDDVAWGYWAQRLPFRAKVPAAAG
jgi:hypothetical protein